MTIAGVSILSAGRNIRTCGRRKPESLWVEIVKEGNCPWGTLINAYPAILPETNLLFQKTGRFKGSLGDNRVESDPGSILGGYGNVIQAELGEAT
jgi:hypothetical protein